MTIGGFIEQITSEGLHIFLTPSGSLKVSGDEEVVDRWLPVIREHKAEVVAAVTGRTWTPGNPFNCFCGNATGWTSCGIPLCPCCDPFPDPEGYRLRMLAEADDLERAALAGDTEMKAARLAVVEAVRVVFTSINQTM